MNASGRASQQRSKVSLTPAQWRTVITAAGAAPSIHNTQPWRFVIRSDAVELHLDPTRTLPVIDPSGRAARLSCGAALLNLRLALRMLDLEPLTTLLPARGHPTLLAIVRLLPGQPVPPVEATLYRAIPRRRSHRRPFHPAPLPPPIRQKIVYAAGLEGGYLRLVHDPPTVGAIACLIRRADHQQSLDPAYRAELAQWIDTKSTRPDGVPLAAGGPRPAPDNLLVMRDFAPNHHRPAQDYESDPLLAVLQSPGDTPRDQLRAGQALQRALLTATDQGAGASMISAPTEIPPIRAALRDLIGATMSPQLVLRLGAAVLAAAAPRHPTDDLIDWAD
jgi:nitroreductase